MLMRSGFPAQAAIRLIRQERDPVALSNEHFEQFLLEDAAVLLTPDPEFVCGQIAKGCWRTHEARQCRRG